MAGICTLTIEQGADWTRTVRWADADGVLTNFTGYTAKMQARDEEGNVVIELSTTNGRITISGTSLILTLTDTLTAEIDGGSFAYDLFVTSLAGTDTRLLAGWMDVQERVTVV